MRANFIMLKAPARTTFLSIKVIYVKGQGHKGFVFFSMHDTAASRGQYLALRRLGSQLIDLIFSL